MAFPSSGLFVATFVDALDTTQLALDLDLDTHKVALFSNSLTGADLTSDTAYGVGAWASNEVTGTNQSAGGNVLTGTTFTHVATGSCAFDATDYAVSGTTMSAIRGCQIYADALAGNNGICAVTFGADYDVTSGTLTIQWNASGIFTDDLIP
jgi:hypothetical protein